jgi:hypothetical protein
MPWKPGQSGNPKGRLSDKLFAEQVRLVVNETDAQGIRKLRRLAERLCQEALNGEAWAMCQIADRLDGKPAQEATVLHQHQRVAEMSDDELARRIAELRTGDADRDGQTPVDPSLLN